VNTSYFLKYIILAGICSYLFLHTTEDENQIFFSKNITASNENLSIVSPNLFSKNIFFLFNDRPIKQKKFELPINFRVENLRSIEDLKIALSEDTSSKNIRNTKSNEISSPEDKISFYKNLLNSPLSSEEKRKIQLDLAQAYVLTKQYPLALEEYEKLIKQNPKDEDAKKALINLFISFAQYEAKNFNHTSALNWYLNAMALDPTKRKDLLKEYTDELSRIGKGPEAIQLYKEILANPTSQEETRQTQLGLAQTYIWGNNHESALKIYDELLKINSQDVDAKKGKAQIYVEYARYDAGKSDHSKAIEWFKKAIEIYPEREPELVKELADQLSYNSQSQDAISLYNEILSKQPSNEYERNWRLNLALLYISKFQYEEALKELDYLLQQNKYDFIVKQAKAKIYNDYAAYNSRLGNHEEAIDWYNKAIENDPIRRPEFLLKIEGEKNQKTKLEHEKPKTVELSIDQTKTETETEKPKVVELSTDETKKKNTSLESTNKYETRKKNSEKVFQQAQEYAKLLEVFQANRAYEISIQLDPKSKNYREQYAWHLQAFSFIEEAIAQFNILLPEAKDKDLFYISLGWDNHTLGNFDASIWAFSHIYSIPCCYTLANKFLWINRLYREIEFEKINSLWGSLDCDAEENFKIKKQLFESYTYLGELDEATSLANEILYYHPEEYMVHYRYSNLLYQKKLYCEAIYQFLLLIKKLPDNAFLYFSLGKVYEDMGNICDAKRAYEYAISLDANPKTQRAYARILSKLKECDSAVFISNQIPLIENSELTKLFSDAEVSLNCCDSERAATIYKDILTDYPYNQDALWGLLRSSTYTKNTDDTRFSYRQWPIVWFDLPIQNLLANYYRPPELVFGTEYFGDRVGFNRFASGVHYNDYYQPNSRLSVGYYYTLFAQKHFNTINRQTGFFGFEKLINECWEFRAKVLENYYDKIQLRSINSLSGSKGLYSKAVTNYHLHGIAHPIPEVSVDVGYDYYDVIDTVPPFNNPIYNYINQIGATALNIRTSDLSLFFSYYKDKLSLIANYIYGEYSDGNIRQTRSFRIDYNFLDLPYLNTFYSYFYLNFKNPAPLFFQNGFTESAYYDPLNFEVHSAGIDTKYDITDKLRIGGEAAGLFFPKCNNIGFSVFGFLNYQMDDHWILRLDLRYYFQNQSVTRRGITGRYTAESGNLQLVYQF
jgi:tetratricopeptide (TPR) repeat protein